MSEPSSFSYSRRPWLWGVMAGLLVLLCGATATGSALLAYLTLRLPVMASGGLSMWVRQAAPSAGGVNRIVVVSEDGSLRTLNPDGTGRRLYHLSDLSFRFPAWSPDGASIAAIGSNASESGVYVLRDADNPQATALFHSQGRAPFYLYWSPNSTQIAFLANDPETGIGLWLADRERKDKARQISSGRPYYWQWLQNSAELFVHSGGEGAEARLGFLKVEDGGSGANIAPPGVFQAPGLSPSGAYLAFAEEVGSQKSQVVIQARQGSERQTAPCSGAVAMSWSPGSDQLAFISPPVPAPHHFGPLRLLTPKTGEDRTLTGRTVVAFFWSPDGRSIAYLSPAGSGNDSGAGLPSTATLASTQPQGQSLLLDLWLLDVSSGSQRLLTTFQPGRLFLEQFLPYFDQYAFSHRLWSPASDALLLPLTESDGTERVYLVPTGGQSPRPLVEGTIGFWSQN